MGCSLKRVEVEYKTEEEVKLLQVNTLHSECDMFLPSGVCTFAKYRLLCIHPHVHMRFT